MAENYEVVVIDDEAPARDVIKHHLRDHPNLTVVAECSNGFEGMKAIQKLKPDLVFLDIQMPKLNGFEMLELLDEPPVMIFCTAYDQYALKAFEVNAADYLLKPFSKERFGDAISKAMLKVRDKTTQGKIISGIVNHRDSQLECLERVVVKFGSQIYIVPVEKLLWLEAQDDYVMLYTKDEKFLKQKTMKFFEEHLDPKEFVRIHRSYIVRIALIKQIELFAKESYKVVLANGKILPLSKTGHTRLKTILN